MARKAFRVTGAWQRARIYPNLRGWPIDARGNLFIADGQNQRVRRIDSKTGIITTVAGNGYSASDGDGGPATSATFIYPQGLALDNSGNLFIADEGGKRVRRVDAQSSTITTVAGMAGNPTFGFGGDGGAATAATLYGPIALAFDAAGHLLIADSGNDRIRKLTKRDWHATRR